MTEMARLKVDVILTDGGTATRAAKQATATIPIVMAQDPDPIGNGFVASLGRPGGNITGLSTLTSDLAGKRLETAERSCALALSHGGLRDFDQPRKHTSKRGDRACRSGVRGKEHSISGHG